MNKYDVLLRPVTTEKTDLMLEQGNQFAFEVAKQANKRQIREAIEAIFDVDVRSVRTMIVRGKSRRWGRHSTQKPAWKKAIVTLAPGESIDFAG